VSSSDLTGAQHASGLRGYATGPFAVDWEERVDLAGLRRDRVRRAQESLSTSGLDALLLWKDENVRYLTSLRAQLISGKATSLNGVLLTAGELPVLLCSGGERDRVDATMPWLGGIHSIPIMEQAELVDGFVGATLVPLLRDAGLAGARLGTDQAPISFIHSVRDRLPDVVLEDGDAVMQRARMRKLPGEIALLEEACAIGDSVTQRALDETRAGRREFEIAGDALQTLHYLGGELAHVATPYVASGENMSPPHRFTTDKIVRHGDLLFVDIGAQWNGYFADIGRTTIVGRPSDEQRRIYRAVYEAQMAGIAAMRPGNTTHDVAVAVRSAVARHDLADHLFSLFIGHGIGVGANEPPYIGETLPGATPAMLEPDMVFAIEPLVWLPGVRGGGGVRLEDMVLVTSDGPRVLSRAPYDERLLA